MFNGDLDKRLTKLENRVGKIIDVDNMTPWMMEVPEKKISDAVEQLQVDLNRLALKLGMEFKNLSASPACRILITKEYKKKARK